MFQVVCSLTTLCSDILAYINLQSSISLLLTKLEATEFLGSRSLPASQQLSEGRERTEGVVSMSLVKDLASRNFTQDRSGHIGYVGGRHSSSLFSIDLLKMYILCPISFLINMCFELCLNHTFKELHNQQSSTLNIDKLASGMYTSHKQRYYNY